MQKESLLKLATLAMIGLVLSPILWAYDLARALRAEPSYQEILLAGTLKKVK